jgi:nitrate reductase gamma subunit
MYYTLSKIVTVFLPYISVAVFILGVITQLAKWYVRPSNIASYTLYPKSSILSVMLRIVLFSRIFEIDRFLWFSAWMLHISLIMLLFGHLRLFHEPYWLWSIIGLKTSEDISRFALISGGATGVLFLASIFMLLARRFGNTLSKLSVFEDYFILLLLILIGITGNIMRFTMHINVSELQQFFISLIYLNPLAPPNNPVFLAHMFLAELLLMYLPFSKLIHSISTVILTYRLAR